LNLNSQDRSHQDYRQALREVHKVTDSDPARVNEYDYRERCFEKLVEIAIDLQDYMGAGRLFILLSNSLAIFVMFSMMFSIKVWSSTSRTMNSENDTSVDSSMSS
jgi:hypothetical protein